MKTFDQPMIWTSRGNVPLSDVEQEIEWRVSNDQVVFIERYRLDGEVVKESTHVKILTGLSLFGEAEGN